MDFHKFQLGVKNNNLHFTSLQSVFFIDTFQMEIPNGILKIKMEKQSCSMHSKSFACHIHIEQNNHVDISMERDNLIIKPSAIELSAEKSGILRRSSVNFVFSFSTP